MDKETNLLGTVLPLISKPSLSDPDPALPDPDLQWQYGTDPDAMILANWHRFWSLTSKNVLGYLRGSLKVGTGTVSLYVRVPYVLKLLKITFDIE